MDNDVHYELYLPDSDEDRVMIPALAEPKITKPCQSLCPVLSAILLRVCSFKRFVIETLSDDIVSLRRYRIQLRVAPRGI